MKNSKEYSEKIKKLVRSLKRQADESIPDVYEEPLEALVFGLFSEHATEAQSRKIYKKVQQHFVDLNDLRVSRSEEIADLTDNPSETGKATAAILTRLLNKVFDEYDSMSLKALKDGGKRQGRKQLEELGDVPRFALDYVFVTALGGHAIPMTGPMREFLLQGELIHPEATEDEIHGFLDRQISAKDGWVFYQMLRSVSEGNRKMDLPKGSSSKKTVKKKAKTKKTAKKKTKTKSTRQTKKK